MKAKLTEATQFDLLRGIEWFESIASGLGEEFELEFYEALDRVKANPEHFSPNHTGFRPCRLNRFTAVLYFRIDGDLIVVVGLFTSGENEDALERRG